MRQLPPHGGQVALKGVRQENALTVRMPLQRGWLPYCRRVHGPPGEQVAPCRAASSQCRQVVEFRHVVMRSVEPLLRQMVPAGEWRLGRP